MDIDWDKVYSTLQQYKEYPQQAIVAVDAKDADETRGIVAGLAVALQAVLTLLAVDDE